MNRLPVFLGGVLLVASGLVLGLILSANLPGGGTRIALSGSSDSAGADAGSVAPLDVPPSLLEHRSEAGNPLTSPFVEVARKVVPAVVSIESRRTMKHPAVDGPQRELFRQLFPDQGDDGDIEVPNSGSGFIIDPRGYVLTNDHVISGADKLTLTLADGRTFDAAVVGTDPGTDVAVVKFDPDAKEMPLPTVPLGDSDEIRVGDWAIAIGNPLGELEGTLTVGIVSAKGRRDLRIAGGGPTYQDFIQTDASINFGNSGGPLVNGRGEVIGINSAVNPTGQGLGFAIPINMARNVAVELIRTGTVHRGYLGILPQEVTAEVREAWDMPDLHGILVGDVEANTPAEKSGFQVGDVIVKFNGNSVADVPEFRALVAEAGVGVDVPVTVMREHTPQELHVVLAERPDTPEVPAGRPKPAEGTLLGATLKDITPELTKEYKLQAKDGALVVDVHMGSPAGMGGLREGDVILEVNREKVGTKHDAESQFKRATDSGKPLVLLVQRGTTTTYLSIRSEG